MRAGPVRFVLIGGFLGAGKTTTIARLARMYRERGLAVGIITNDQADDLVDTLTLRSLGFDVGQVAGACFCCNFNELTQSALALVSDARPDIILAEPVGSCTDLVATVIRPLMKLFGSDFEVACYGVVLKPEYGNLILEGDDDANASKQTYIFRKQLEEADVILLNKVDDLSEDAIGRLIRLAEATNPGTTILPISAKTGHGFDELIDLIDSSPAGASRDLEVDYDIYAEGEAELGWLNATARVWGAAPFQLDELLSSITESIRNSLSAMGGAIAHLKVSGLSGSLYGVANVVDNRNEADLSIPSGGRANEAEITVNARIAVDPDVLAEQVRSALEEACGRLALESDIREIKSFRPGRPVPVHRYAAAAAE